MKLSQVGITNKHKLTKKTNELTFIKNDVSKIIVAKGFKKSPKVQKSGHTDAMAYSFEWSKIDHGTMTLGTEKGACY